MAASPRRTRRRPYGALLLLALLIAGLGWVLYLRLTDQPLRDPFGFYRPAPALPETDPGQDRPRIMPPAEGKVRAWTVARDVPAYSRVLRDDLFDGRRGAFAFIDVDAEDAERNGILTRFSEITGRVLAYDKRPGFVFTEDDFMPKGTRPGLAGGIPPGKRAMRIDVGLVTGIIGLNPGDRFDVVAAHTVAPTPAGTIAAAPAEEVPAFSGVYSELIGKRKPAPTAPQVARRAPEARVDVVVQGGVVVAPLSTRLVPTSSASLTSGQINGTRPVQEMVIAVDPEEVAPLMAAIRLEADLTCLARSGHPDDPVDSLTPGLAPEDDQAAAEPAGADDGQPRSAPMPAGYDGREFAVIETIVGGVRTLTAVPRAQDE